MYSALTRRALYLPRRSTLHRAQGLLVSMVCTWVCWYSRSLHLTESAGEYRMSHAHRRDNLVIITSEPLTKDVTDWYVGVSATSCLIDVCVMQGTDTAKPHYYCDSGLACVSICHWRERSTAVDKHQAFDGFERKSLSLHRMRQQPLRSNHGAAPRYNH